MINSPSLPLNLFLFLFFEEKCSASLHRGPPSLPARGGTSPLSEEDVSSGRIPFPLSRPLEFTLFPSRRAILLFFADDIESEGEAFSFSSLVLASSSFLLASAEALPPRWLLLVANALWRLTEGLDPSPSSRPSGSRDKCSIFSFFLFSPLLRWRVPPRVQRGSFPFPPPSSRPFSSVVGRFLLKWRREESEISLSSPEIQSPSFSRER